MNQEVNEKKTKNVYKPTKLLGQGSFGKAYLVECEDKVKRFLKFI